MSLLTSLCATLAAILAGAGLARWWQAPTTIPDHSTPFVASARARFAGRTELAQRVTPQRNQWLAVDLIIAAEEANLPGTIELRIAEWPSRHVIRTARRPAADAPSSDPWQLRPGQPAERWLTFGFEPIPDSAGGEYLLSLSYPDGRDAPGSRLATLARYPGRYPPKERQALEVNGNPVHGNLLLRLAAAGTHGLAVQQAGDNLARQQPYFPRTLLLPAALAATCSVLASALALAAAYYRADTMLRL